jgi:hypothetical protein
MWPMVWRIVKWTAKLLVAMAVMLVQVVMVLVLVFVAALAFMTHFVEGPPR